VDGAGGGAAGAGLEDGAGGAAATVAPFPKKKSSTGEDDTQGTCSPLDARETLFCVLLKIASYVAKAKSERGPIRFRMRAICSLEAKIDEARVVGMKCEPIPRKPLAQNTQYPLGVAEVCERHHGIVGEPDEGTSPVETGPHLVLEPFIQHMVQENVREAG
jgi:hypothetical protein